MPKKAKSTSPSADEVAAEKGGSRQREIVGRRQARLNRRKKAKEVVYAKELYAKGMSKAAISKEIGRAPKTISSWLAGEPDPLKAERLQDEQHDVFQEELVKVAQNAADQVEHEYLDARAEEEQAIAELAASQNTPADQYQAYVASQAIKIMRDNLQMVRGPRTIRELSELDQIIRRSLGLNPKGGSGGGKAALQIDISLLNNTKAVGKFGVVIDAEPTDEDAS